MNSPVLHVPHFIRYFIALFPRKRDPRQVHHLQHVHRAEFVRQGHAERVEVLQRTFGLNREQVPVFGLQ